ncbi:TIGR01906 family membrane protein [Clostridium sp.]|uniref:TIGR01906 family membrane protein n=1 Tax=Clostridium sp. TaxID=1506 RepID=UPI003F375C06
MNSLKKVEFRKNSINIFLSILFTIALISLTTLIVLNLTVIYEIGISKLNLESIARMSSSELMENYNIMINYLKNPFIKELNFISFPMSLKGRIHFEDVKRIFTMLYIFIISFIAVYIAFKSIRVISGKINFKSIMNYSANIITTLLLAVVLIMYIDFTKAFELFHKIFFRNDYWIFDSVTDPIINVLPEKLFMIYALIIVMILLVLAIVFKGIYYRSKVKNVKYRKCNRNI